MRTTILSSVTLLAATGALAAQAPGVGSTVDYTFREPPMNARGVRSLDDLRGKPTMIEFWGTR